MDKKQPDLFRLIHSLTKSEKRYFKVYASRHIIGRENNYLKLFNAMEQQKEYDEAAIRKQFRGENFVRQLGVTRNYLYKLIMESMRIYHADKTPQAQIRSLLHDADFFMDRLFTAQAARVIDRAKKLVYKHEAFSYLPEVLRLERRFMTSTEYAGKTAESIDNFSAEYMRALSYMGNLSQYWDLSARMFIMYINRGSMRSEEDERELRTLVEHPLLKSEEAALTFEAKEYYYHINGTYYFLQGDYDNAWKFSRKHIELLEQQPGYVEQAPTRYLGRLSIYIVDSSKLRHFDEFFAGLEKIKNFRTLYPQAQGERLDVEIFKLTAMLELYACIELGDTAKGLALVPFIEDGMTKYGEFLEKSLLLSFRFNLAGLYFLAGHYDEALRRTNDMLNAEQSDVRQDIYGFLRLFNIILHYEMGHDDLIEYLLKSTYRYLYTRKKIFKFESIALRLIRKLTTRRSGRDLVPIFRELREELRPLVDDPYERKAFEGIDVIAWLDSKIEGKPLVDIIRRRSGWQQQTIATQHEDTK